VAGESDLDDGVVKSIELLHFPQASCRHPGEDPSGSNLSMAVAPRFLAEGEEGVDDRPSSRTRCRM
jgi:hypothetical protein